jgi:hemolysin activation/secretion protein
VSGSGILPLPGLCHRGGDPGEENPPTDVLACGGFVTWVSGELPFWALPSLGGSDTLRGYIGDRFTDRAAWHASAEWRLWTLPRGFSITDSIRVERLGLAPFYDCGSVAGSLSDLRTATVRDSYGLGFRCSLERTALFRLDVGRSREETTFCIAYGLSF